MAAERSASLTRRAQRDLVEIAAHYGEKSLELELRFLRACEGALGGLLAMPKKGVRREHIHDALANVRMWPIPEFPRILIFYRLQESGLEVLRILHTSRGPQESLPTARAD